MNHEIRELPHIVTKPITDVVRWTASSDNAGGRLLLPPIQRSLVWKNSQIINYWDSLLRGYPTGLMLIHYPKKNATKARTANGEAATISTTDLQLFDGQQRLTAILLGFGQGQLRDHRKLWVDLGGPASPESGLLFALRVSSTGQPFGYQASAPNEKCPLHKRQEQADQWMSRAKAEALNVQDAFGFIHGTNIIDATCALPLFDLVHALNINGLDKTSALIQTKYPAVSEEHLSRFLHALKNALQLPILFQLIDSSLIEQEDEYVRFFERLGQGGTALTKDELTYSIIKHHFPEIHDRMKEITEGQPGRLASEVNLVLGALWIAKVTATCKKTSDWMSYRRPQPACVSLLRTQQSDVLGEFHRLLPHTPGGRLLKLLESVRGKLAYDKTGNPAGLPIMLLARMPHQLVDVLLLMESESQNATPIITPATFALYWLLFIEKADDAANTIFRRFAQGESWNPCLNNSLITYFEKNCISRRLPNNELLSQVRDDINTGTHVLREWGNRFAALDANKDCPMGHGLRILSTHGELIRRVLLWMQREYLCSEFSTFDPTSSRDEDLPIDLDHLIPHTKFGNDWRIQKDRLTFDDKMENFRRHRGIVGNSLGNFRWLDASANRRRQADRINEADSARDFIKDVNKWNKLIDINHWTEDNVAEFQRIIDHRTIDIFESLLKEGRLEAFVRNPSKDPDA